MSSAMRPLLEFIDGYRRRVAAPENTLIRKKYSSYTDLTYIQSRLNKMEDETYRRIYESKQVSVDMIKDDYSTSENAVNKGLFPSLKSNKSSLQNLNDTDINSKAPDSRNSRVN